MVCRRVFIVKKIVDTHFASGNDRRSCFAFDLPTISQPLLNIFLPILQIPANGIGQANLSKASLSGTIKHFRLGEMGRLTGGLFTSFLDHHRLTTWGGL